MWVRIVTVEEDVLSPRDLDRGVYWIEIVVCESEKAQEGTQPQDDRQYEPPPVKDPDYLYDCFSWCPESSYRN